MFKDVPIGDWRSPWIERLYFDGITSGCGTGIFCPKDSVTRGQAAVFLLRAKWGAGYVPPAATGTMFNDFPLSHPFAAWIEELAREGITGGCSSSPPLYCPDNAVSRAQMSVFLQRITP